MAPMALLGVAASSAATCGGGWLFLPNNYDVEASSGFLAALQNGLCSPSPVVVARYPFIFVSLLPTY